MTTIEEIREQRMPWRKIWWRPSLYPTLSPDLPPALRHVAPDAHYRPDLRAAWRFRDLAILAWVAARRYVLTQQLLRRFFLAAGLSRQAGFDLIHRLVGQGLLASRRLDPRRGAASREYLRLTAYAYTALGIAPDPAIVRPPDSVLRAHLQLTEIWIRRRIEGWLRIPADQPRAAREAVAAWLIHRLGRLDGRPDLLDLFKEYRRLPEREAVTFGTDLLVHPRNREVRFLLPVYRGTSYKRVLEGVWVQTRFERLPVEVVCYESAYWRAHERTLGKLVQSVTGLDADLHVVPPFSTVPLRRGGGHKTQNLYAAALKIAGPLDLPLGE